MFQGDSSHLPLKLNSAGVIPPIFAFIAAASADHLRQFLVGQGPEWLTTMTHAARQGSRCTSSSTVADHLLRLLLHGRRVQSEGHGDNLKKYGGFLPGIRPVSARREYIDYVLTSITVVGALYLAPSACCLRSDRLCRRRHSISAAPRC
jgi:preprotein translocase subunit SecY